MRLSTIDWSLRALQIAGSEKRASTDSWFSARQAKDRQRGVLAWVVLGKVFYIKTLMWGWAFSTVSISFYWTSKISDLTMLDLSIGISTQRVSLWTANSLLIKGREVNKEVAMSWRYFVTKLKEANLHDSRPEREMGYSLLVKSSNVVILRGSSEDNSRQSSGM